MSNYNPNGGNSNKSSNINISVWETACRNHMANNQLPLPYDEALITDGQCKRYSADSKRWKKDEYYYAHLFDDYMLVNYGSNSDNSRFTFKSYNDDDCDFETRTKRRIQSEKHQQDDSRALAFTREQAAIQAQSDWDSALLEPRESHMGYFDNKGIYPIGLRFDASPDNSTAYLAVRNIENVIRSYQRIFFSSEENRYVKRFLGFGEIKGNSHTINNELIQDGDTLIVCEGYATGNSIYCATRHIKARVVCALSRGNIENVVAEIMTKYKKCDITIAADNDKDNDPITFVARKYGLKLVFPTCSQGKDFNDVHKFDGIDIVTEQLKNFISFESPEVYLRKLADKLLVKEEPCENFNLDEVPPILKDHVDSLCSSGSVNNLAVLTTLLVSASAFIGKKFYIEKSEYEDGFFTRLYANIWVLSIAPSGQFKSTALDAGSYVCYEHRIKVRNYTQGVKKQLALFERNKGRKSDSDLQAEDKLRNHLLAVEQTNVLFPERTTPELLLQLLGQNRQGAIFNAEFGGFIKELARPNNVGLMAMLTKFYDVVELSEDATKTQGENFIERPYISIGGVSTIDLLSESLQDRDVRSGFYVRFLIYSLPILKTRPRSLPHKRYNTKPDTYKAFKRVIETVHSSPVRQYKISQEAQIYHQEIYDKLCDLKDAFDADEAYVLTGFINRWSATVLKIAMIMQLFLDEKSNEITVQSLKAAFSVIVPAIKSTLRLFKEELGASVFDQESTRVYNWIVTYTKKYGKAPNHKTLMASRAVRNIKQADLDQIFVRLQESGKIAIEVAHPKIDSLYVIRDNS